MIEEIGKYPFAGGRQAERCAAPVTRRRLPDDEAQPVQFLDKRRDARFVPGDRPAEGDLGDTGIVVNHHHRGEPPGLQPRIARVPRKRPERSIMRLAKVKAEKIVQHADGDIAAGLLCVIGLP
jgi:hypothetical protein